jgi:dTDP-glucose 4,6-dehydratase
VTNPMMSDMAHILYQCSPLWKQLRGKRIFVTGGTGFVGRWMAESFAWVNRKWSLGAEMVILSRTEHQTSCQEVTFVQGDVRDFAFLPGKFTYIIHAAGGYGEDSLDVAIEGTQRVLDFAQACGAERVLYLSSGAVYRQDAEEPKKSYGEGKRAAEALCAAANTEGGLQVIIAKLFAFVGPYLPLDKHYAIGNFIGEALKGGPIRVVGGENVWRSYLYASDLVIVLWYLLMTGESRETYHVGSPIAISISDLADLVGKICGVEVEHIAAEQPEDRYYPGPGHAPSVPLAEAIEKTVAWHRREK